MGQVQNGIMYIRYREQLQQQLHDNHSMVTTTDANQAFRENTLHYSGADPRLFKWSGESMCWVCTPNEQAGSGQTFTSNEMENNPTVEIPLN